MTAPRRPGDESGAILVLTAILLTTLVTITGGAIGIGREAATKRTLHSVADIAAQDALAALGAASSADGSAGPQHDVDCAARLSASRNGLGVNTAVLTGGGTGTCATGLTPVAAADGMSALAGDWNGTAFTPDNSAAANAVQVTASRTISFDLMNGLQPVSATAIAIRQPSTGVRVGSFAARLSAGSVTDQVASAATFAAFGTNVDLASYTGLAAAQVTLGQLLAADPTFGSVTSALAGTVTVAKVFNAAVVALGNQGNSTAAFQLSQLEGTFTTSLGAGISLGKLFDIGATEGAGQALSANANVLEMVHTAGDLVDVANGTSFVTVNPATISIPGVTAISVKAGLISPAQEKYPALVGDSATDTQASVEADLTVPVAALNLGLFSLSGTITIPLVLTAANGTATITAISCGPGLHPAGTLTPVTMSASTSAVTASIGAPGAPATLGTLTVKSLGLPAGTVALSDLTSGQVLGSATKALTFTSPFFPNLIPGAGGAEAGRGDPTNPSPPNPTSGMQPYTVGTGSSAFGTSTLAALEGTSGLTATVLGSSLNATAVASLISTSVIGPVLSSAGANLLPALAPLLGIDAGGADVWNTVGVNCTNALLVK